MSTFEVYYRYDRSLWAFYAKYNTVEEAKTGARRIAAHRNADVKIVSPVLFGEHKVEVTFW